MADLDYSRFFAQEDNSPDIDRALAMAFSLADAKSKMEARNLEMQQVRQQMQAAEEKRQEGIAFQQDFQNFLQSGKKDAQSYASFMAIHPSYANTMGDVWKLLDERSRLPVIDMAKESLISIQLGQPEKALERIAEYKKAAETEKNEVLVRYADLMSQAIKTSISEKKTLKPGQKGMMETNIEMAIMNLIGQEDFANVMTRAGEYRRAEELQPYEVQKSKAEVARIWSLAKAAGVDPSKVNVKATNFLDDGTVQLVMTDGTTKTVPPDVATQIAVEKGVELQKRRAGGRRAGAIGAELGKEAYSAVGAYELSMRNIEESIKTLDTGKVKWNVIWNKLPSFNEATIRLENLQNRGAIDVLNSVRLAPVSNQELAFAMRTSLPPMDPKALRNWLVEKLAGQRKLLPYLKEQAKFMGGGQKSIDQWMEYKEGLLRTTGEPKRQPKLQFSTTSPQQSITGEQQQKKLFEGLY